MNPIIREKDLLSRSDMNFVKAEKIRLSGSYVLLGGDISAFFDFCSRQGIKTVFYSYDYYNKADYTITDSFLKDHTEGKKEFDFIKQWADQYNALTDALDYEEPSDLDLCASLGALAVAYFGTNEWMTYEKAEEALASFQEEHEDELSALFEYNGEISLIDELRELLLTDANFRNATNKSSRRNFMERFLEKKANKRFWKIAKGAKNEWDRQDQINNMVDRIYNEYRNTCYRLKIPVGNELPKEEYN
ncbi:MAG: hypothetical protein K6G17_07950 [Oscillospiraceae bacterium]|nr:hypothetical protein [Oscillospiraceae bacterium]